VGTKSDASEQFFFRFHYRVPKSTELRVARLSNDHRPFKLLSAFEVTPGRATEMREIPDQRRLGGRRATNDLTFLSLQSHTVQTRGNTHDCIMTRRFIREGDLAVTICRLNRPTSTGTPSNADPTLYTTPASPSIGCYLHTASMTAHYDIFRHHLLMRFPAYGHAIWEPDPGNLYPAVKVGDVGYIREGKFHRLFNALLPAGDASHADFGVPEHHEPLTLSIGTHINTGRLGPNNFCSAKVSSMPASERQANG
jgi:hypothetical protein